MIKIPSFEKEKDISFLMFLYKDTWCIMARSEFGSWCGYIKMEEDHPWINDSYDDINNKLRQEDKYVHGGLTFKDEYDLSDLIKSETANIFIGFDCGHINDIKPLGSSIALKIFTRILEEGQDTHLTYKDIEYVMNECKQLADWVIEAHEVTDDKR